MLIRVSWLWSGFMVAVVAALLAPMLLAAPAQAAVSRSTLPHGVKAHGATQIIIAHTASRKSTRGTVELWEKRGKRWYRDSYYKNARFGYRGLTTAAAKREGDGRTPMGSYTLPYAFGRQGKPAKTKISYRKVDKNDQWCSNVKSKHYNTWMWAPNSSCQARQAEVLSQYAQYDRAVVINANPKRIRSRGSAIFLHMNGKGSTAGCVSVTRAQTNRIVKWLNPKKKPRITIAPRAELKRQ